MGYLRTREACRAYVDSNAAQFARVGNPWDGDGKAPSRATGKARRPKGRARVEERSLRPASEAFMDLRADAKLAALIRADRGTSRTVTPTAFPLETALTREVLHVNRAELRPLTADERAKRGWQKLQFAASRIDAERAYLASEAFRDAERRRLQHLIELSEARLAVL